MALNPFFLQGSKGEQNLIQDLINEQIKIYGVEVHYLPRKFLTEKTVIREVIESQFDNAYPIEAYLENYDGYGDNTTILSKFGIQSLNEVSLTISRERFETYITPLLKKESDVKLRHRPKEGDLIYFPLGDRLFEIKYVEHEQPFYQLNKTYTYTLKCELFRYENEDIETGISEIDDFLEGSASGGYGSADNDSLTGVSIGQVYRLTVVGAAVTATATISFVNGGIRFFTVTNRGGGYSNAPRVAISSAPAGGITGVGSATMISGIVVCNDNVDPAKKSVQSVEVVNSGSGYTVAPKVAFYGDGEGATATSTIANGVLTLPVITNAGSGYINPPTITFVGVSTLNISAAATAVVSSAGSITQIRMLDCGAGYTATPSIIIGPPQSGGSGDYEFNETIVGSSSSARAKVRSWNSVTNLLEVSNVTGSFDLGENLVGETSGASHSLRIIDTSPVDDGYASNNEIESEADLIVDFSERNPFGTP